MNKKLAAQALNSITDPYITSEKGWCQRFVRLTVTKALGEKWGDIVQTESARKSALKLKSLGYAKNYVGQTLEEGDLLYKTEGSGGYGHVGILVKQNRKWMVAENSSYQAARKNGFAKGLRTLAAFKPFQVVARLPEPQSTVVTEKPKSESPDKYFVQGIRQQQIRKARIEDGQLVGNIADALHAVGFKLTERNDRRATENRFDVRAESE